MIFHFSHKYSHKRLRRLALRYFTVGFIIASILVSFSFSRPAHAANFSMQTGYYMGTGASLTISGLGFTPNMVMIKSSTSAGVAVFKTSAMPANATAFTSATADNTASNVQLVSDGFTVGTLANVNSANVLYHWTAFTGSDCSATGNFCVGSYTGTGTASRTITTGFQPDYVMVKRSTAVSGSFRVAAEPANEALFFDTTARSTTGTHIASFSSTGFSIGSTNNTSSGVFYYVAFKATSGLMAQGSYTGNATDNTSITGTDFTPDFAMIKNATSATSTNRNPVMNFTESYGDNSSYVGSATANLVNAIQGLQSNGFQIGTAVQVNESAATFYWVAFGGETAYSSSGSFEMDVGSYTGTGTALPITGLGFTPDLVIIKDTSTNYSVFRTSLMAGDMTAYLATAVANFTGGITSFDPDGFTLGTSTATNASGGTYHWQAFGGAHNPTTHSGASDFAIGAYYGNGIDNRNVTRLPFQPDMVTIKRNGTSAGVWRTSAISGDFSAFFGASAETANYIQGLTSDGFQIGTNTTLNTAAGLHYWFAFKAGDNFSVGSYTGTGAAQTITSPGFQPDLAWVKRSTAVNAVQRSSTLTGDTTQYFANLGNVSGRITGFTPLGFSLTGTATETNASSNTYRYAAWHAPSPSILSVDIVDNSEASVVSPSVIMPESSYSFQCRNSLGTLGINTQRLRITNTTNNPSWSLSIAATGGATASWQGNLNALDYNDSGGSPGGCSDSADSDSAAGQMTVQPSSATLTPQSGCTNSNISLASNSSFDQASINSITLATASSGVQTGCYWDMTNIGVNQTIPAEQPTDTYTINLTMTLTAF